MNDANEPPGPIDLQTLCRACGLCCDGSLFGLVPLEPEEVAAAGKNRLRVLPGGKGFEQPCPALAAIEGDDEARACSVYAERPVACRRFVCRLYDRHRRDGGELEPRLSAVRRVRVLLTALHASGFRPADFEGPLEPDDGSPKAAARALFAELTRRLEDDFARAPAVTPPGSAAR